MSTDDCYYYFMKGQCTNRYCQYRHNPRPKMKVCHYWATSGCYNYKCPYLHNNYGLTRPPQVGKEQTKGSKEAFCTFHMHGKCTKGDTCQFKHEAESATQLAADEEGNSDKIREAAEILKKYSTSTAYAKKRKVADAATEHSADHSEKIGTSVSAVAADLPSTSTDNSKEDDERQMVPSDSRVVEEARESMGMKRAKKTVTASTKMKKSCSEQID